MGNNTARRHTQAYSFVYSDIQDKKMQTTQAIETTQKPLTVRDVITRLIEADVHAWKGLPQSVRDALLDRPQDFQFNGSLPTVPGGLVFTILYNGVVIKQTSNGVWVVDKIVR
jgi:hypothetical protein